MSLTFKSSDRLFFVAPHPDDESLAMGGLLQRASQVGAAVRVLFATNGDNNPWPQRWAEKRWQIGQRERRRWGALRRREARQALKKLGFQGQARFLNLPDQGITTKLLTAEAETLDRLCCELQEWQPTHLIIPSSYDLHPDHNALFVLFQIALDRIGRTDVTQWHFLVHCRRPDLVPLRAGLQLSDAERLTKRQAILCHTTQMVLSRNRFLAYARPLENFYERAPVTALLPHHRVGEAFLYAGALNLSLKLPSNLRKAGTLLIAAESQGEGSLRWRLPLPSTSRKVRLREADTGQLLRYATVRITGRTARVKIPMAAIAPLTRLFVKLDNRKIFLDESGWREVPVLG